MSNEEVGKYIRLLCYQHQDGVVTQDHIDHVKGITPRIQKKFELDADGNLFNKRLRLESEKRKNYTESRRNNRLKKNDESKDMNNISSTHDNHMKEHMFNHMTNHMENENENENKDLNNRKGDEILKLEFEKFRLMYQGLGKRGLDKEWDYFKKRHKNYAEIVPTLVGLYEKYLAYRKQKELKKEFLPEHKNFKTYINNSSWEEMYEVKLDAEQPKITDDIEKYRSIRGFDEQTHLCGMYQPRIKENEEGKYLIYVPNGFNY
jgi:hypothetical protein